MKKAFSGAVILIVFFVLVIVGCEKKQPVMRPAAQAPQPAVAPPPQPAPAPAPAPAPKPVPAPAPAPAKPAKM